jgi:hypothetical protein
MNANVYRPAPRLDMQKPLKIRPFSLFLRQGGSGDFDIGFVRHLLRGDGKNF